MYMRCFGSFSPLTNLVLNTRTFANAFGVNDVSNMHEKIISSSLLYEPIAFVSKKFLYVGNLGVRLSCVG